MARLCSLCVLLVLAAGAPAAWAEEKIRIVNEGGIRGAWTLPPGGKLAVPGYPAEYAGNQSEVCLAVGYLINPDGHTSDFALLKAWGAQEPRQDRDRYWGTFARDASSALSQWHFLPRPEVVAPRPVYTVATFVFASPNVLESRKRCAIPNLVQRIVELRQDSRARRRMTAGSVFDRLDIDPSLEMRYSDQQNQRDAIIRQNEPPPPLPPPPPPNPASGG